MDAAHSINTNPTSPWPNAPRQRLDNDSAEVKELGKLMKDCAKKSTKESDVFFTTTYMKKKVFGTKMVDFVIGKTKSGVVIQPRKDFNTHCQSGIFFDTNGKTNITPGQDQQLLQAALLTGQQYKQSLNVSKSTENVINTPTTSTQPLASHHFTPAGVEPAQSPEINADSSPPLTNEVIIKQLNKQFSYGNAKWKYDDNNQEFIAKFEVPAKKTYPTLENATTFFNNKRKDVFQCDFINKDGRDISPSSKSTITMKISRDNAIDLMQH